MKGPAPSIRDSGDVTVPEVKVKRKCGRPRNPIPRHQRPSHIEAEQKRRVKIQEGLQSLKNFLPPEYQTPGRESKADILLNSVRYTNDYEDIALKQKEELEELRAEAAALNAAITSYQQNLPDEKLFEENPLSAEQRFDRLVAERTKGSDNTMFSIFGYLMKPLHQSFEKMSDCSTIDAFLATTRAWANQHLSRASLRPMITDRLQELSKEKSFLDIPEQAPQEAPQRCRPGRKPKAAAPATVTSTDICQPSPKRQAATANNKCGPKAPRLKRAGKRGRKSNSIRIVVPSSMDVVVPRPDPSLPSSSTSTSTRIGLTFAVHGKRQAWSSAAAAAVKTEEFQPKAEFWRSCSVQPVPVPVPSMPYPATYLNSAADLPKVESSQWESYQVSPAHLLSKNVADSPISTDSAISLSPPPSSTYESSLLGGDLLCESSLDQCYEPLTPATPDFRQGQSSSSPLLDRGGDVEKWVDGMDWKEFQSIFMDNDPSALNMELLSDVDSPLLFSTDLPPSPVHADPRSSINTDSLSFFNMGPSSSSHMDPPSSMNTDRPSFTNMVHSSSSHMEPPSSINTDPPSFTNMDLASSNHMDPPSSMNTDPPSSMNTDPPSSMNTDPPSFTNMDLASSSHMDPPPSSSHMDPPSFINNMFSPSPGIFDPSPVLNTSPSMSAAVPRMDHSPALPHDVVLQHDFLQQGALQQDGLPLEHLQLDPWQLDAWPPLGELYNEL